jgi:hypothetical protein
MFLPRCPEPMQLMALRLTARRFCIDTELWAEDLDADTDTVADQLEYQLTPAYDDVRIHRVTLVKVDTAEVFEPYWSIARDNVLTLDPAPVAADLAILAKVVYVPTVACAAIADWIVDDFAECLAAGAMAHLRKDPGGPTPVPWFEPSAAAVAEEKYMDGVFIAKCAKATGRKSGEIIAEIPRLY